METKRIWTTAQLAKRAGLTQQHVSRLVKQGRILGIRLGHDYIISDEEALRFLESHKVTIADSDDKDTASTPEDTIPVV